MEPYGARPDNITEQIWKDMSETAFDVVIGFIHDSRHQRLVMGCGSERYSNTLLAIFQKCR